MPDNKAPPTKPNVYVQFFLKLLLVVLATAIAGIIVAIGKNALINPLVDTIALTIFFSWIFILLKNK